MPKITGKPTKGSSRSDGLASKTVTLTNRGTAGLLNKLSEAAVKKAASDGKLVEASSLGASIAAEIAAAKKNRIAGSLRVLILPIESLTPDPQNARLHPTENLEAIRLSLARYGQLKPIVARRKGKVVLAGNGTLEAAKSLGWTQIAVSLVDLDDVAASGYAIADNRTAELAKWDLEIVARLERLQAQAGKPMPGWTADEIIGLRIAGWVEPPEEFPEVDESIEVEHQCPRCGYRFSGGATPAKGSANGDGEDDG